MGVKISSSTVRGLQEGFTKFMHEKMAKEYFFPGK